MDKEIIYNKHSWYLYFKQRVQCADPYTDNGSASLIVFSTIPTLSSKSVR